MDISIHALLAESDGLCMLYDTTALIFLSTLSLRRATAGMHAQWPTQQEFLSTLSLRRATFRGWTLNINGPIFLSTLSLRRATLFRQNYECFQWIFLSTLSLRRATCSFINSSSIITYFYPRSPCGERPAGRQTVILII